jgi:hypothetical protein
MAICGPTLAGLGKPEIEFHLKWLIAVIYAIALLIAIQFSLTVILWTVLGMYVLRCVFMSFVTFKVLGISVMNFSKIIIITSISTILVFIVEVILGELLQQRGTLTQLLLKSASAALVWVSVVCVSRKHIQGTDLLALITKVANQMNKSAKDL